MPDEVRGHGLHRRGLDQASIDEVAANAGYTKGTFYANFESKEELFLATLDERFARRVDELDRVLASEERVEEQAREAGPASCATSAQTPRGSGCSWSSRPTRPATMTFDGSW